MTDKQTVKVGDKIKSLVTQLDVREGATYEVKNIDFDGDIWVTDDVGDRFYLTTDEFELLPVAGATGTPAFKVGDRVRLKHAKSTGTIKNIPGDGWRDEPSYAVNWDWYPDRDLTVTTYESEIELASLTIETGKFYRTRDGRKVGPMRRYNGGWLYETDDYGRMWRDDGMRYYEESRGDGSDLIAEWVDESASNDNQPVATQPAPSTDITLTIDYNTMELEEKLDRVITKMERIKALKLEIAA
ncbi:hypothetical protein [Brucella tritici]|uniref:hypothetical protein n=1 Tax=Brucella tritici TaxID=94626 RepID=UPI0020012EBE|nr:hypothetical protein [Brucella tritici]